MGRQRNERGFAATEFAILLPVLIGLLLGAMTAFDAFRASRILTGCAMTVADIAARQAEINDAMEDDLVAVSSALLGRYRDDLRPEVTMMSVTRPIASPGTDDAQTLSVDWFHTTMLTTGETRVEQDALLNAVMIPTLTPGDSVVVVQVIGTYKPVFAGGYFDGFQMRRVSIRRPRFTQRLLRV